MIRNTTGIFTENTRFVHKKENPIRAFRRLLKNFDPFGTRGKG